MKVDAGLIDKASQLAENGFSNLQICEAVQISESCFYKNLQLVQTVKEARLTLRDRVSNALLERAVDGDVTSLIFLSKRMNLFSHSYKKGSLKTAQDALAEIEKLYKADMPQEMLSTYAKLITDFTRTLEVTELEKRVEVIENFMKENNES